MTFVGFDLHKRYITACALDEAGEIIAEIRQLSTALETVLVWLASLPGPVTVGCEATLYWEWLATRLAEQEHTVPVAHAFHVKLIWQARAKTDPIDARQLAELLRVNLFPAIWIPDLETRRRRQLLRGRAFLVRERTRLKNRIHGHLTSENLVAPGADLYGKGGRAWLATAPLSAVLRAQTERLLTLHDAITREIEGLDGEVKRAANGNPSFGMRTATSSPARYSRAGSAASRWSCFRRTPDRFGISDRAITSQAYAHSASARCNTYPAPLAS